ncbi:protein of unknown function [Azospirillum baldaniorum]|uniref:Uncharacterized protein n=1 Tax=Azospirillum baldaniorum TaxID=1064539 RepID=A0A9P1JPK7_9PROT|nr:protein of unknown function [Azospirillum baldaniorum]
MSPENEGSEGRPVRRQVAVPHGSWL